MHEISVLIAYAQKSPLNARVSNSPRGLIFGLSLHLYPYFVYANSEGSGVSVHMLILDKSSDFFSILEVIPTLYEQNCIICLIVSTTNKSDLVFKVIRPCRQYMSRGMGFLTMCYV